jgi:glutathione peroxidase
LAGTGEHKMTTAHEFEFDALEGGRIGMADFAGKVVLVVNTASECGFTTQYSDMEALWRSYQDRDVVVLGVPSNDFGKQEPGDETDIREFCAHYYRISFPMTAKQHVIGPEAHPFYAWIARELGEDMAPKWNFHKYLIDTRGAIAGAWPSKVEPRDKEIGNTIQDLLSLSHAPERSTLRRKETT